MDSPAAAAAASGAILRRTRRLCGNSGCWGCRGGLWLARLRHHCGHCGDGHCRRPRGMLRVHRLIVPEMVLAVRPQLLGQVEQTHDACVPRVPHLQIGGALEPLSGWCTLQFAPASLSWRPCRAEPVILPHPPK